uniref:hypothetical protein n=1 Tax=Agathobacter sp. TaxID=2021311 RepID=UPI0040571193
MGLVAVAETAELISAKQVTLSETDKEFVVQFAFATGDKELTNKLIDELACEGADKGAVLLKYSTMTGFQPDWIRRIENLLVALEMYRIQEEKAIQTLSELLTAYGADLTMEEIKEMPTDKVREHFEKKETMMR